MKKFYSDKHIPTILILWIAVIFLLSIPFLTPNNIEKIAVFIPIIICVACAGLLLWILLGTNYKIEGSYLKYKSGPITGKIDIFRIHTIEHQKNWMVATSLKPALGSKGIIIKYNKFDDIYISPKKKQEFIDSLLEINSHIEIKN
jgi:hypothetical protein